MPTALRFAPFGTTIFTEITALASKHSAINLGQGFPDFDGPREVIEAAHNAMLAGHNQYAPMPGLLALREAIAESWNRESPATPINPDTDITITAGCTEAICAAILGITNPGEEVITFEPFYDSYPAAIAMAGAVMKPVLLRAPGFAFDGAELARAFTPRTRAILINTPHNPTGRVFTREELALIASLCQKHNTIAITDEVYDRITYERSHVRLAMLPGMAERTITLNSLGKAFSLTGWKIGWAIAPPELTRAIRAAHQFITFAVATPLQHAAAHAVRMPEAYFTRLRADYTGRRDFLCSALRSAGFAFTPPEGAYFIMADHTPLGLAPDDAAFCRVLIERYGVAAIPPSSFYTAEHRHEARSLVRFAFCKRRETLRAAAERLAALRA